MAYQKDISAILGLSISTVSRALKGYPDISEETRRKVLRTAEELDYRSGRRNGAKAQLKRSGAIGILAPGFGKRIRTPYFRELLCGMAAEAADNKRDLVIMGEDPEKKRMTSVGWAADRKVDGICLLVSREDLYEGRFAELLESRIPMVSIENNVAGYTTIRRDLREDVRRLLLYLKERGHFRTAHFGNLSHESRRLASLLEEESKRLEMSCMEILSDAIRTYTKEMKENECEGPTCLIFESIREGRAAIAVFSASGIRVPADISVAVVENSFEEKGAEEITCVADSPQQLGKTAIHRLLQISEHPETDSGENLLVSGPLQEGNTVKDFGVMNTRKL